MLPFSSTSVDKLPHFTSTSNKELLLMKSLIFSCFKQHYFFNCLLWKSECGATSISRRAQGYPGVLLTWSSWTSLLWNRVWWQLTYVGRCDVTHQARTHRHTHTPMYRHTKIMSKDRAEKDYIAFRLLSCTEALKKHLQLLLCCVMLCRMWR